MAQKCLLNQISVTFVFRLDFKLDMFISLPHYQHLAFRCSNTVYIISTSVELATWFRVHTMHACGCIPCMPVGTCLY